MGEKIKIEIHSSDYFVNIGMAAGWIVLTVWLAVLITHFSVGSLIAFLVSTALYIGFIVVYEKIPTVIIADDKLLKTKHLLGWKTVELSKIKTLTCEPYTVRARYSSLQRIRLNIIAEDDVELELTDSVNTEDILNDKLKSKETDIPIIRLYDFLKKRTPDLQTEEQ